MRYLSAIILILLALTASAQESQQKCINNNFEDEKRDFFDSKTFEILHVGLPLAAVGLAIKPFSGEFKNLRDSYCPYAHTSVDDYLQYAPAALMVGLKAAGVESRSSWGRMLASDALSVAMVTLATNGLKLTTNVGRPDTGANNSFPSGHTATAFMTATMLHKEYGAVNKWYSIAGYSAATATGLMRVINNRHWISDVLVGAGLGIIATEVGYLLADIIFGDHGLNKELDRYDTPSWYDNERPSSIGLYLGVVAPLGRVGEGITISTGSKVGFEGAYFLNRYLGVGGRLALSNNSIYVNRIAQSEELDIISGSLGCYYARPLSARWRVATKALVGLDYYEECTPAEALSIEAGGQFSLGTGLSIEYLANQSWAMKVFCDYDASHLSALPHSNFNQSTTIGFVGSVIF